MSMRQDLYKVKSNSRQGASFNVRKGKIGNFRAHTLIEASRRPIFSIEGISHHSLWKNLTMGIRHGRVHLYRHTHRLASTSMFMLQHTSIHMVHVLDWPWKKTKKKIFMGSRANQAPAVSWRAGHRPWRLASSEKPSFNDILSLLPLAVSFLPLVCCK